MSLKEIAQQVMGYLDSVGVAAEYYIHKTSLTIETDDRVFIYSQHKHRYSDLVALIKARYPIKSPN